MVVRRPTFETTDRQKGISSPMTIDFSEEAATRAVMDSFAHCGDALMTAVQTVVVRHLHGFTREIEPVQHEWDRGIQFPTESGRLSLGRRQELILLSDVLAHRCSSTPSTTGRPRALLNPLCPFHLGGAPTRDVGADIALTEDAPRCVVRGIVQGVDGHPRPRAVIDVWQAHNVVSTTPSWPTVFRKATFAACSFEHDRRVLFPHHRSQLLPNIRPRSGGPTVGCDSSPSQPTRAYPFNGKQKALPPVVSHLFVEASLYLDDNAVFGVRKSPIREAQLVDGPALVAAMGWPTHSVSLSSTWCSIGHVRGRRTCLATFVALPRSNSAACEPTRPRSDP